MAQPAEKEYLSITELAHLLNAALERTFPRVRFEGEISEVTFAKSGHLYICIKDETSQLQTVMWRTAAATVGFKPARGMLVVCEGRPNVYNASGRLQIVLSSMRLSGEGALQKKFLELKAKLEKEGLFDPARKRPIPFLPRAVGVVTSHSGAVIHDIMVRIKDRFPSIPVFLVDVKVQGEGASKEIADGIRFLNEFGKVDVIIVGRGGGSLEDLWAFNEEEVVRAIFASKIPVISSVGHEVDISLSDFVADVRAPTPTAAGEMVSPKRNDLIARVLELEERLSDFGRWLRPLEQKVDNLELRLEGRILSTMEQASISLKRAEAGLKLLHPERILTMSRQKILALEEKLHATAEKQFQKKSSSVDVLSGRLEALNPFKVLNRGYSLVEKEGHVVSSATMVKENDLIKITFGEGRASAVIR